MINRLTIYEKISRDWEYNPMAATFIYKQGVAVVTKDVAMEELKRMKKDKYPNAWILDALNYIIKEVKQIE